MFIIGSDEPFKTIKTKRKTDSLVYFTFPQSFKTKSTTGRSYGTCKHFQKAHLHLSPVNKGKADLL